MTDPDVAADELMEVLLPLLADLPEMTAQVEIGASHDEVMRAWIRGTDAGEMRAQFTDAATSAELFSRFLEHYLGYRLPWGASGLLRIARSELEIADEEVTPTAQYLSAMLKFGVSTPAASWAMTLGVPSRAVAQAMGADFSRDHPAGDFGDFRPWLGAIDLEGLRTTYGIRPPLLDAVQQVCLRTGSNPLLHAAQGFERQLPAVVPVRGIGFENRAANARAVRVGQPLSLQRDYDNIADRNAILLFDGEREIGYVPRSLAQLIAAEMDTGRVFRAEVDEVALEATPRVVVRVAVADERATAGR